MVQKLDPRKTGKKVIGLTGTFGSGKSTVAHFFEELGAEVVDADRLAHETYLVGSPIYGEICEAFEEACLAGRRSLDLKMIAKIIFSDTKRRQKLESMVHPYVFERMAEEIGDSKSDIVVAEVPLLFESGYHAFCDQVIVVKASREVMEKRLKEKGFSHSEIVARWEAQLPLEEKIKKADFVIDNSENFQKTRREVEVLWKKLQPALKGAK